MTGVSSWRIVARVAGAGLLVATAAIHLDLYLTGYRTIPTIGWLFLLQVIAGFGLAALVLATKSRVVSAIGAGFAAATLGGYLLSLWLGLFGFREVRTEVGIVAGIIEIAAFAALASVALVEDRDRRPDMAVTGFGHWRDRLQTGIPHAGRMIAACSALAAVLLGVAVSSATAGTTPSSTTLLKVASIRGVNVVTNAKGFTLYWFVPDSRNKSTCYGTCADYWPPVTGSPRAGPGVTGRVGSIRRSGGQRQATYDGHPLYTYVADGAPGQAAGNDINLNGGVWHEMDVRG